MRHAFFLSALVLSIGTPPLAATVHAQSWRDRSAARSGIRREIRREHRRDQRRNALIGAGIGALGGAILSDGDPWATAAGAAAGRVVGGVTTDRPRYRLRDRNWRY